MNLEQLTRKVDDEYKKWCSIRYFVSSEDFKFVFEKASIEDRKKLFIAAANGDQHSFKIFIKRRKQELEPFHKLSYRRLRSIASYLKIFGHYNMNKATLVEEIKNEVQRVKANPKQIINKSQK